MPTTRRKVLLTTLMAPMLVAFSGRNPSLAAGDSMGKVAMISSDELAGMLKRKDFAFVNVHIPYEGEIEGTDAFIPFDKMDENLDKLPKDKNAKVVLYCRSGRMSAVAAKRLTELGYTQVSDLTGGMIAWEASGRQILKK
ncbi:rhodanese-like domain-containing protein [Aminobacter sp. BE322]|uniref:rhodanese-like domain-containing protein n=1 Tax=unclassified Aminobacter TaxID=2644704 RepID=UPI003D251F88